MYTYLIFQTNLSYIDFNNLNSSTEYVARFWTLIDDTLNHVTDTPVQVTIEKPRDLDPVKNIRISHFDKSENPNIKAILAWEPSIGMCDIIIL